MGQKDDKISEFHFELHPYSPYVVLGDFYLFANFGSIEGMMAETKAYFATKETYRNIREALEWLHRSWRKLCWWIKLNFCQKVLLVILRMFQPMCYNSNSSLNKSKVLFPQIKPIFIIFHACFNNEVVTIWHKSRPSKKKYTAEIVATM